MMDDLRRQIDEFKAEYNRLRQNKDDEIAVLQASLDKSIVAMANIQEQKYWHQYRYPREAREAPDRAHDVSKEDPGLYFA